jgi:hypothetical protein
VFGDQVDLHGSGAVVISEHEREVRYIAELDRAERQHLQTGGGDDDVGGKVWPYSGRIENTWLGERCNILTCTAVPGDRGTSPSGDRSLLFSCPQDIRADRPSTASESGPG